MVQASTPWHTTWAGEAVHLLPELALWWPRGGALFVADVHLGKAGAYRALGQPVPSGTTGDNLARLDALLTGHPVQRLVFLGDLLHAPQGVTPALLARLRAWRHGHAAVAMQLVRGNHDRRAGDPPSDLGIEVVDEPHQVGPFAACHHPQVIEGRFVLAGHLHPAVTLQGPARDRLRLPCFCVEEATAQSPGQGLAVLPAFGAFTGTWVVAPTPGRQVYAAGGGAVWPVSLSGRSAGG